MAYLRYFKYSLLGFLFCYLEESCAQSYKAAVVPHSPQYSTKDLPDEIENKSKNYYIALIRDVSQMDIVVFPEHGITTLQPNSLLKPNLDAYSIQVPEVGTTMFKNNILSEISKAAKDNGIYVVINVLEKPDSSDMKFYSADVVFDQNGKLIAKCRKKYLYKEINYDKGEVDQKCTFVANFRKSNINVTFALLFDTDLLTMANEGIHDAILTSSLPNMLPFSFGVSLQAGYSVRNKVNLLVSGYTQTSEGHGGSGIYQRNSKSWVTFGSEAVMYREISITNSTDQSIDVIPPAKPDVLNNLTYEEVSTLTTTDRSIYTKVSDSQSYCKMDLDVNGADITPYKWVALAESRMILGQQKEVLICALIKPQGASKEKKYVNGLTIDAVTKTDNIIQVLPISVGSDLLSNLVPVNYQFAENRIDSNTNVTLKLTKPADLSVFGVLFILKNGVSHGTSLHVSHVYVVGFLSVFLFLWKSVF